MAVILRIEFRKHLKMKTPCMIITFYAFMQILWQLCKYSKRGIFVYSGRFDYPLQSAAATPCPCTVIVHYICLKLDYLSHRSGLTFLVPCKPSCVGICLIVLSRFDPVGYKYRQLLQLPRIGVTKPAYKRLGGIQLQIC